MPQSHGALRRVDSTIENDRNTATKPIPLPAKGTDPHPIVELLHRADGEFRALLNRETYDVAAAARQYREKRGRHPPPGFDKWWQYAYDNRAMFVEDFWNPIYDDLNPMWALDPKAMLADVRAQKMQFRVRNGTVTSVDPEHDHFWMEIWLDLIQKVAEDLPDMDLAMNTMDEPRLLIPWENMKEYVKTEHKKRKILPVEQVTVKYSAVPPEPAEDIPKVFEWDTSLPIWERTVAPCPPDSLARKTPTQTDFNNTPILSTEFMKPHIYEGYISNYTLSTSICHQPDLQGLHGYFIEPISTSTSDKLFPMFGSSKLTVNSEILLPAAMYYKVDERYTSQAPPIAWQEKTDTMIWRGLASGGRSKADNWKGFHRHRLVSMLNGTQALAMPNSSDFINIENLPLDTWHLQSRNTSAEERPKAMSEWLTSFTEEVGFTDLNCFPMEENLGCSYTGHDFHPLKMVKLTEQHKHKYLVDIDGNSFSGRYRDFLLSGSLPIKATLFREWHDSRLVAWKHFVPFDNRFLDIYGVMEFFLGFPKGNGGRDELARKIAEEGQQWARKVLRPEDMKIYVYRLLLEYARVMDEKRDTLGWVDDSISGTTLEA
ncbi:hypothetical protein G7Y89_g9765 [Cudoniella acicularis]|uniref:Glycosyl transferase CAP10 domain-containing protein n=1 Tax=Cudoniella acicularis TaxID=354080 RepID=A0A8H4RG97_9HELO|nr:hypothetical protein G7Y89_g9765 [Cudoniella acicularis]